MRTVKVKRHPTLFILLHWVLFAETFILLISGFSLTFGASRDVFRNVHIAVGSLWLGTVLFFLYYMFTSDEYKWLGLSRLSYAVDYFFKETKLFLDGFKAHPPIKYNPEKGEYEEKVVPTEVLSFWGWVLLFVLMAVTGLALTIPELFGCVAKVAHFVFDSYQNPFASLRILHFVLACVVVVFMIFHAYAVIVFGLLGSMISGYREEPVE